MPKFKIKYIKEAYRIAVIEAQDESEARQKFDDWEDVVHDYEDNGIDERIEEVYEIDD